MSNLVGLMLLFVNFKLVAKFDEFILELGILSLLLLEQRSLIIELIQRNLQLFLHLEELDFSILYPLLLHSELFHSLIKADVGFDLIDLLSLVELLQFSHLLHQKLILLSQQIVLLYQSLVIQF